MDSYPALDFLRKVEVWQRDETGTTAGLAVMMPGEDQATLATLLAQLRGPYPGAMADLETRARYWLVGYRELNPPLTLVQRAELYDAIHGLAAWQPRSTAQRSPRYLRIAIIAGVLTFLVSLTGIAAVHFLSGPGAVSQPVAGAPVNPGQQPVPGGQTDLQQFRADWKVPAVAQASAGDSPVQVVLLQDGLYYPAPWGIPAGDPGWAADTAGSITAAVSYSQVAVTDNDGNTWTVTIGQPFVLASNPQVVFRVLRDATIQSMPQTHAIAVRIHL
jgi:hypothetical protein